MEQKEFLTGRKTLRLINQRHESNVDEYGNCSGSSKSAIIREEVARGRITTEEVAGVKRLVPNMVDEIKDKRPYPTVERPVTWILGGIYIHYTTGSQKYWECGDYFQSPNMNPHNGIDRFDEAGKQPVDGYVDQQAAIASLFAQSGSSGQSTRPIDECGYLTDEQAAIARLFG